MKYDYYDTSNPMSPLSLKLAKFGKAYNTAQEHSDKLVIVEDLQYNLSALLAKIILALDLKQLSKENVVQIIKQYNDLHGTSLSFENYMELGYLRIVNAQIKIPRVVNSFLHRLKDGINEDQTDLIKCLVDIYKIYIEDRIPTIGSDKLNAIIKDHNHASVSISFLEERDIISVSADKLNCYWKTNNSARYLRNRISALLWLHIAGKNNDTTLEEFRSFIFRIKCLFYYPDNLKDFLPSDNLEVIQRLAISLLSSEEDLAKKDGEAQKYFLDEQFSNRKIDDAIPALEFHGTNTYEIISEMKHFEWFYPGTMDPQGSRSIYILFLKLIIQYEPDRKNFSSVVKILKQVNIPYLVYETFRIIKTDFPEVIPFILEDEDLSSVGLMLIDKLHLDDRLFPTFTGHEEAFEKKEKAKDELWKEAYDLLEKRISKNPYYEKYAMSLCQILWQTANEVFQFNSNTYNRSSVKHEIYLKRYKDILEKLSSVTLNLTTYYPEPAFKVKLIDSILPDLFKDIPTIDIYVYKNNFLKLDTARIDLSIELLRMVIKRLDEPGIKDVGSLNDLKKQIINYLSEYMCRYFEVVEIEVNDVYEGLEMKVAKRGVGDFGVEIVDWGYFFLSINEENLIEHLDLKFNQSLIFDFKNDKHDNKNQEQNSKLSVYLKIMMIAFIAVNENRSEYERENFNVANVLEKLQKQITSSAIKFTKVQLSDTILDIFYEQEYWFNNYLYKQTLKSLLYRCLNFFTKEETISFLAHFFGDSKDLGKMLSAINIIESPKAKKLLIEQIEKIDPNTYITSLYTLTDLESALVDAANSEYHYKLADPLLARMEPHLQKSELDTPEARLFLFRVKLLIAFRKNDIKALTDLTIPDLPSHLANEKTDCVNRKIFYTALYNLANDLEYDKSILALRSLLSKEPYNIEVAFNLYKRILYKNLLLNNSQEILRAQKDWQVFVGQLDDSTRKLLNKISDAVNALELISYSVSKDYIKFDQIVNITSGPFLYDEKVVPIVYSCYHDRGLHEIAYSYINSASSFYSENELPLPGVIDAILDSAVDDPLIGRIKTVLSEMRSLSYKRLPKAIPSMLNDKIHINEFILHEIVSGAKIMRKKIKAVEAITHEDHYNDILLATLRLRLAVWGWDISDQPRSGISVSGKGVGEIDILITAAGVDIGMIEALNFKSRDAANLEKHIKKCTGYQKDLGFFFMISYYKGRKSNFDSWSSSYQEDIKNISYEANWEYDIPHGFKELYKFDHIENIKISKTVHGLKKYEFYHIMIDMSLS